MRGYIFLDNSDFFFWIGWFFCYFNVFRYGIDFKVIQRFMWKIIFFEININVWWFVNIGYK